MWGSVALGIVVWGVALWILQCFWSNATGEEGAPFASVFFYGWGALLEQPPRDPSVNVSGQVSSVTVAYHHHNLHHYYFNYHHPHLYHYCHELQIVN